MKGRRKNTRTLLGPGFAWALLALPAVLSPAFADTREVRVGVYANEPKIFLGEDGQPSGILGDLLVEMAKREDWSLRVVPCDWQECLAALSDGRIDLLPDLAYSREREEQFAFHRTPALHSWSEIYRREGVHIDSMLDLEGKRLAVLGQSVQERFLHDLLADFGVHAELLQVGSLDDGFRMTMDGRADAVVANRFFGDRWAARYRLAETPVMFQPSQLYYGSAPGRNADLRDAVDRHLEGWLAQSDSIYFDILARWMEQPPLTVLPDWFWRALALLCGLLGLSLAGGLYLRRQVGEKTRHLRIGMAALEQSEARHRAYVENAPEGIFVAAADGRYLDVNPAACALVGYSREELLDMSIHDLAPPGALPRHLDLFAEVKRAGTQSFELTLRRKDGRDIMVALKAVVLSEGRVMGFCSDISALKEYQRQLERIAHYDTLTGLPNRVLLADRLHQAMILSRRHGKRLVVAYIDLDGFKGVNDLHGHEVGDHLLKEVATGMRQALREGDTLARLGGDEFVAVLIDLDSVDDGLPLVRRMLDAVTQPIPVDGLQLRVTGSVGVTLYPQPEPVDADQLLRQADQAMYQAKLAGKDRYQVFDADQDRNARGRHESRERIRQALRDGEFELHYQPKVNMRTGEVVGAEALIRWRHPERGLLVPGLFLPETEDNELAVSLGEWVVGTALARMRSWQEQGLVLPVSVNISAYHLQSPDFVARLQAQLRACPEVPASRLELEVLETSALNDIVRVSEVMSACAALGLRFALDDFGTGYSSLAYLKRLPADVLKIDQSFVRDMLDDPDDLAILEGVLGLAGAFRCQAVAEGVETPAHGELLIRLGCELAQGYAIARPMPADDIPAWLEGWRPDPIWSAARLLSKPDQILLYADVEYRSWLRSLAALVEGPPGTPTVLGMAQWRFGAWLAGGTGRLSGPGRDLVAAITRQHDRAISLANELQQRRIAGDAPGAGTNLSDLHGVYRELRTALGELIRIVADRAE